MGTSSHAQVLNLHILDMFASCSSQLLVRGVSVVRSQAKLRSDQNENKIGDVSEDEAGGFSHEQR